MTRCFQHQYCTTECGWRRLVFIGPGVCGDGAYAYAGARHR
jgi:hypothetical protein